jgi:hypothetical protein
MTWFTALTACPAPIGPTWVIVRPSAVSTGLARSTSPLVPADKDRQGRVPSALAAAGNGGVDEDEPDPVQSFGKRPAPRWRDGRAVNDERALAGARGNAIGSEQNRLHVRCI